MAGVTGNRDESNCETRFWVEHSQSSSVKCLYDVKVVSIL